MTNLTTSIKKNASQDAVRQVVARVYELIVLGLVCWFALATPILALDPELKAKALSLFGLIFTPEFLVSFPLVSVLKSITVLLAILWACGSESRAVFVATPISFVLLMSIAVETQYFTQHQTNFCAIACIVLAAARIHSTLPGRRADPLPKWAFTLMLFYITISYTYSGICKLAYSGVHWADGTSLMMWIDAYSVNRDNLLFEGIVSRRWFAAMLQATTLIAETFAILALFIPRLRPILGLLLVGFHVSVEYLLGLGFYANILLDLYLLVLCFPIQEYRTANGWQFLVNLCSSLDIGAGYEGNHELA